MRAALERLYNRMLLALGRAIIQAVTDSGAVQTMQVQLGQDEIRDATPRVAEYGFTSNPLPGAFGIAVFLGGDRSNGIVIATGDQRYRLKSLVPGEVALYDDQGQMVYMRRAGIQVKAVGKLRLEGDTVEIVAHTTLRQDVGGYASEMIYEGGTTYQNNTWQQGATVNNSPNPVADPQKWPSF